MTIGKNGYVIPEIVDTGSILPAGASTSALQTSGNASVDSIDNKIPSGLTVTSSRLQVELPPGGAGLTDAELRATPVPVSGTLTAVNNSVSTTGTAVPGSATMVGGTDGTNLKAIKVSSTGVVSVDGSATIQPISGTVTADAGSGTFAVSALSLPLPTGAATETTLSSLLTELQQKTEPADSQTVVATNLDIRDLVFATDKIDVSGSTVALDAPSLAALENISVTVTSSAEVEIKNDSGNPIPISAVSLPLPTGAATAALQTQPGVDIGDVTINNASGISAVNIQDGGNSITVDGTFFQATQPVSIAASVSVTGPLTDTELRAIAVPISGTVIADAGSGTFAVSATSLPLPSDASTETTLSALNTKVPVNLTVTSTRLLVDGSGVTQPISVAGSVAVTGPLTDTQLRSTPVPVSGTVTADAGSGTFAVSAATLPLPSGAATSANQSTIITSLSNIDAGIPTTLGQTTMAASMPVTIASNQTSIPTSAPINTNGLIVNTTLTTTTASTASVPANAVGFILEAPSSNTDNIRWAIGSTASTTIGILAEPGRDTGYIPCSANISICATVSGTNAFSIQWILSS